MSSSVVAVVTGANAGVGLQIAKELFQHGCTVVMACRSLGRAEEARAAILDHTPPPVFGGDVAAAEAEDRARQKRLRALHLDLASFRSIRSFNKELLEQEDLPCVDILVCNAGINTSAVQPRGPCPPLTEDGFNVIWQVNYLGHFALTRLLLPRLRASRQPGGARVVNVSSVMHRCGEIRVPEGSARSIFEQPGTKGMYSTSKLAQVLAAQSWQEQLNRQDAEQEVALRSGRRGSANTTACGSESANTQAGSELAVVTVHCCNPGAVASDIWRYDGCLKRFVIRQLFLTTRQGAASAVTAAIHPHHGDGVSKYFQPYSLPQVGTTCPTPVSGAGAPPPPRAGVWERVSDRLFASCKCRLAVALQYWSPSINEDGPLAVLPRVSHIPAATRGWLWEASNRWTDAVLHGRSGKGGSGSGDGAEGDGGSGGGSARGRAGGRGAN